MSWELFTGDGQSRSEDAWRSLPPPPPWRRRDRTPPPFEVTKDLVNAVNAALHLRRPLLLTGRPGSGKSTLVDLIAAELSLGEVLRWHITSKSTLVDALYQYDALGRLHATQIGGSESSKTGVERYVTLGALGTALASPHPRALLIDEIDKSDLDLPGDLLNVLELGEFEVPPLARAVPSAAHDAFVVYGADRARYEVPEGVVRTRHFPVIVLASNGERTFPPPFLRRCIRFNMPVPNAELLTRIVRRHLGDAGAAEQETIGDFAEKLRSGHNLAIDQLLNLLHLVTGTAAPGTETRAVLETLLLEELSGR